MRKPAGYTEIKTERLLLRTLTRADAAAVRDFGGDEFKTKKDARKYIRWVHTVNRKPLFVFYIWLAQTGQHIGRVYIHSKPELDGEVEIGYGIAEEHCCNGYATEAAQAAVRFAFEQAGQEVLCAIVKPENIASLRVINKLGFMHCGTRMVLDENGVNCAFDYFKLYNSYRGDKIKTRPPADRRVDYKIKKSTCKRCAPAAQALPERREQGQGRGCRP